jgi:cation transport protein ChaC
MTADPDPFAHHPELRDQIADPDECLFRRLTTAELAAHLKGLGLSSEWWHPEEKREAMRAEALAGRLNGDVWVFAYGSLMWDPGFRFAEVRRGHVCDHARRFILKDIYGGRGTRAAPGLMAALDKGSGCNGLLFRIAREIVDEETAVLWGREQIGPCYTPAFVSATMADGTVTALTFIADYDAKLIDASLTREEQIRYLATGTGFLGSSLDYLRNIDMKFKALGIEDEEVAALLRDTETYAGSL